MGSASRQPASLLFLVTAVSFSLWPGAYAKAPAAAIPVERLTAARALPPEVAGRFRDLADLRQASDGSYYAFDRRAHTVHRIDRAWTTSTPLVRIGQQPGELLRPSAFDADADLFALADAPFGLDRIQVFYKDGTLLHTFQPQVRSLPRITIGSAVMNGAGSLALTAGRILLSEPDSGGLVTEYTVDGRPLRQFGTLRATGHESNADVHIAMNTGIPVAAADGGVWFVFQAGVPMLRRYDSGGSLLFERHIEGRQLDALVQGLPDTWPRRGSGPGRSLPLIAPNVQAAAVGPDGSLWVGFTQPLVYVFDAAGDKVHAYELSGAGLITPSSLAFSLDGNLLITPGGYEFAVPAKKDAAPARTP